MQFLGELSFKSSQQHVNAMIMEQKKPTPDCDQELVGLVQEVRQTIQVIQQTVQDVQQDQQYLFLAFRHSLSSSSYVTVEITLSKQ